MPGSVQARRLPGVDPSQGGTVLGGSSLQICSKKTSCTPSYPKVANRTPCFLPEHFYTYRARFSTWKSATVRFQHPHLLYYSGQPTKISALSKTKLSPYNLVRPSLFPSLFLGHNASWWSVLISLRLNELEHFQALLPGFRSHPKCVICHHRSVDGIGSLGNDSHGQGLLGPNWGSPCAKPSFAGELKAGESRGGTWGGSG